MPVLNFPLSGHFGPAASACYVAFSTGHLENAKDHTKITLSTGKHIINDHHPE